MDDLRQRARVLPRPENWEFSPFPRGFARPQLQTWPSPTVSRQPLLLLLSLFNFQRPPSWELCSSADSLSLRRGRWKRGGQNGPTLTAPFSPFSPRGEGCSRRRRSETRSIDDGVIKEEIDGARRRARTHQGVLLLPRPTKPILFLRPMHFEGERPNFLLVKCSDHLQKSLAAPSSAEMRQPGLPFHSAYKVNEGNYVRPRYYTAGPTAFRTCLVEFSEGESLFGGLLLLLRLDAAPRPQLETAEVWRRNETQLSGEIRYVERERKRERSFPG